MNAPAESWYDRGHLRDGIVYCTDPDCRRCDLAIAIREDPIHYCTCGHAEMFHYGPGRACRDRMPNSNYTAAVPCECALFSVLSVRGVAAP